MIIAGGRVVDDGAPAHLASRSRYHNAVSVHVQPGLVELVRPALESLEVVAAVEQHPAPGGMIRLTAIPREAKPIYGNVSQLAQAHGWAGVEVRAERGELEDVFRTITAPDGRAPGEIVAAPPILIGPPKDQAGESSHA